MAAFVRWIRRSGSEVIRSCGRSFDPRPAQHARMWRLGEGAIHRIRRPTRRTGAIWRLLLRAGARRSASGQGRYVLVAMEPAIRAAIHSRLRHSSVFSPAEIDGPEPHVAPWAADAVREGPQHQKEQRKSTHCSQAPQTLFRRSSRDDPDGQYCEHAGNPNDSAAPNHILAKCHALIVRPSAPSSTPNRIRS